MFTVKKIDFKQINDFINLPYKIYKGNPYWIPQLDSENKKLLSEKNPYWKHAKKQLFLAYDDKNNIISNIKTNNATFSDGLLKNSNVYFTINNIISKK